MCLCVVVVWYSIGGAGVLWQHLHRLSRAFSFFLNLNFQTTIRVNRRVIRWVSAAAIFSRVKPPLHRRHSSLLYSCFRLQPTSVRHELLSNLTPPPIIIMYCYFYILYCSEFTRVSSLYAYSFRFSNKIFYVRDAFELIVLFFRVITYNLIWNSFIRGAEIIVDTTHSLICIIYY